MTWRHLQRRLDRLIDIQWGEPVELYPWRGAESDSTGENEGPDPNRQILKTVGVYMMPGARLTGEAGTRAAGMATQVQEAAEWISIQEDNLGGPNADWRQYDRVYLPNRGTWHTINMIEPSATYRPNVHLIRLQEVPA